MVRKMAVAGYFYPDDKAKLEEFITKHAYKDEKEECLMALVPHAGYLYSGAVTVQTLTKAKLTDTVIILGNNHTGFGERIGVWSKGAWETPLGDIAVDEALAAQFISTTGAKSDVVSHVREHAIETMLPILKYINPDIKILPVSVMGMDMSRLKAFANDLAAYMGKDGYTFIISSDMNHYESVDITDKKDFLAIDQILDVDGEALYDTVMEEGISMCGVYPAAAALMAARKAGAVKGELVAHTTSAAASNDTEQTVGYAGIIVK